MNAPEAALGRDALESMDEVLSKRPEKDDHRLTEVTKALCAWRDALIARHRQAPLQAQDRDRLERLNAVIGVVVGVQFPQAAVPWNDFTAARRWLADLLEASQTSPA